MLIVLTLRHGLPLIPISVVMKLFRYPLLTAGSRIPRLLLSPQQLPAVTLDVILMSWLLYSQVLITARARSILLWWTVVLQTMDVTTPRHGLLTTLMDAVTRPRKFR